MNGFKEYYENTVEITTKARVPKGEYCDSCSFKKGVQLFPFVATDDCCNSGYWYCGLYGERLELEHNFNFPMFKSAFKKCSSCLEDTKEKGDKQ